MSSAVKIKNYKLKCKTHKVYDVAFSTYCIHTILTHTPSILNDWISVLYSCDLRFQCPIIIGIDIEWRPTFRRGVKTPAATLQLCFGTRCVIFQLLYCGHIPQSLVDFLSHKNHVFTGVGVENDAVKLESDYGLKLHRVVDLRRLAAEKLHDSELNNAGLKRLAQVVLGETVEKPKRITMSRWDKFYLSDDQVQYASVDAFLSFEIARQLHNLESP